MIDVAECYFASELFLVGRLVDSYQAHPSFSNTQVSVIVTRHFWVEVFQRLINIVVVSNIYFHKRGIEPRYRNLTNCAGGESKGFVVGVCTDSRYI